MSIHHFKLPLVFACLFSHSVWSQAPFEPRDELSATKSAQVDLALRLQQLESSTESNVLCSPYDLFETLTLLEFGARGKTLQELNAVTQRRVDGKTFGQTLQQIRESGLPTRPSLGANVAANEGYGVKLEQVEAWQAKLRQKDLIFTIDDEPVRSKQDFASLIEYSLDQVQVSGYEFASGRPFERSVSVRRIPNRTAKLSEQPMLFATGLWVRDGLDVLQGYQQLADQHFAAKTFHADLSNESAVQEQAAKYFKSQLVGRLKDDYQVPELSNETAFVLTSTVNFQRKWKKPFDIRRTKTGEFKAPQSPIQVAYMTQREWFQYTDLDQYQTIDLPYSQSSLAMLLVLPKSPQDLAATEHKLLSNQANYLAAIQADWTEVDLQVPRFSLRENKRLKPTLQRLGVQSVFNKTADLGGMFANRDSQPIWLEDVYQHASLEVNETGTTAGSQTTAVGVSLSASKTAKFQAHHPFLFFIHDEQGTVFFSGRVMTPTIVR